MKKILLILIVALLGSCTAPKFIVIDKQPSNVADYCTFDLKPINKKAMRLKVDGLYSECGSCEIGDTLIMDKRKYTNY